MTIEQAPQPTAPPQRMQLGKAPGQPSLYAPGLPAGPVKRELMSGAAVLPELEEAPAPQRKLWRHPAFLVSIITTFLALVTLVVLLLVGVFSGGDPRVTGLELTVGDGNAHLSWSGPDVAYSLYAVAGSEDIVDLSQAVREGREAWIPVAIGQFDHETCFVVRPSSVTAEVSLGADELDTQGAQSTCVADAQD